MVILNALIAAGANVNAREVTFRKTALMLAIEKGHAEAVKALIAAGADVNARDSKHNTALTLARARGQAGTVDALIASGAIM